MTDDDAPPPTTIPAELIRAYEHAIYRVDAPAGAFELRVGRRSEALGALMTSRGVTAAAFVTAFNPFSERASDAANAASHERLRERVAEAGFDAIAATGLDPQRRWPDEHGLMVLGIARDDAITIGRAFGQNAVLHAGADAVPAVVPTR